MWRSLRHIRRAAQYIALTYSKIYGQYAAEINAQSFVDVLSSKCYLLGYSVKRLCKTIVGCFLSKTIELLL